MHMTNSLLSVENVNVSFRTTLGVVEAVNDVSFSVGRRETLAVVGESGSGKSVTARAIMGMLAPNAIVGTDSKIIFDGDDLSNWSELELQKIRGKRISMIFQEPLTSLNPIYRIGDQIGEIITAHKDIEKNDLKAEVLRLMREVQLPDPEQRYRQYPHEMSGGQRQRVMIAMALANNPDLLIADEPTTALDVTVQAEILSLLKELQKTHEMAILLITHDLSVVSNVSDKVAVMRHGKVVERGVTSEVFKNPQHPYTKHLIESEPKGLPDSIPDDAPLVMEGKDMSITYVLRGGGFFTPKLVDLKAVDNVTARVHEGETLGVVGESGSGKTTLAMSLIRLGEYQKGEITFKGDRIDGLSRKQLLPYRSRMQVVFQDPFSSLNPRMIIRQILEEGLVVNKIGGSVEERDELVRKALDDVQMPHSALERFPHEFSGGQRQRLAIARAIVLDPEFILLDEPTSALDLSIQSQIIDLLRDLRRRHKLSYMFISHDLKVVKALCHNVIVMQHGRVMETGPTAKVLANPETDYTRRLVDAAFKVIA